MTEPTPLTNEEIHRITVDVREHWALRGGEHFLKRQDVLRLIADLKRARGALREVLKKIELSEYDVLDRHEIEAIAKKGLGE